MRDLRLIGVHDDGEHLVVADGDGEQYRLLIDEPLRAAARRDRPRLGQLQIEIDGDVRPRDVQAMIRAGATADEVAARTGWSADRVARFEGPVIAEREHVARQAQTVRLRGTNAAGGAESLAQRAATRLASRDVEAGAVAWDSARDGEGQWTVSAVFSAGGKERVATWWFDTIGMSVVAKNDEAKWLSEAEAPAGPVPTQVHRPTAVFDVEAEERVGRRADTDDLIASMREHSGARSRRRGRRRTAKGATEEALPIEGAEELPPAARGTHPNDVETAGHDEAAADEAQVEEAPAEETPVKEAPVDDAPVADPSDDRPPAPVEDAAAAEDAPDDTDAPADAPAVEGTSADEPPAQRSSKKKGRARVPSWDDVMFGAKRD